MVFRTTGIILRFLRLFTFFENPKSRDFLRFFAVFRTFSRTMLSSLPMGAGWVGTLALQLMKMR